MLSAFVEVVVLKIRHRHEPHLASNAPNVVEHKPRESRVQSPEPRG
jgi:hypothetical protein